METTELEERMTALERELAQVKARLDNGGSPIAWWQRIAGTFEGDPVYREAMQLGREYRESQTFDDVACD